jgi:hypothetical protein
MQKPWDKQEYVPLEKLQIDRMGKAGDLEDVVKVILSS